ncbi:GIY-YIG nuclease family protein [Vibrio sp.]|uniref:GIY-YIG nuclease family protein n=1 Tax=Vibrio sp. TaxID=678 RepID=UPI003AA7B09F
MSKQPCIYILTSNNRKVFYVGVTSQLKQRIWQHRTKQVEGFSNRYNTTCLVYYELFDDISLAISREKRLKKWKRDWKVELIQKFNPELKDLYDQI